MGPDLGSATVEFAAPIPPNIIKDRPSAFNEDSLNAYCKFAQLLTSPPRIEEIDFDFDLHIEFGSGMPYWAHFLIVLYMDPAI